VFCPSTARTTYPEEISKKARQKILLEKIPLLPLLEAKEDLCDQFESKMVLHVVSLFEHRGVGSGEAGNGHPWSRT
jgi:hypothetical protein